ncbi:5-deoxy-glucuronate isomerase [Streptomyces canus]|uniref:5-deoxy-glucuronate isomerase n=1 Tax=Streptomyces canus TaxID=58343 RepID=UPI00278A8153|nr:5-deoxy-glucuronate isomerase [Streptomyces canus]MDQ0597376.1 5-deoxy-glucuronate isomerase [Streptomyces canus]
MTYHLPAGKALGGPYLVDVSPESAGWGSSALRVLELPPGGTHTFDTGESVFTGVSDLAYVPRDCRTTVSTTGGGRGPASDVPVELRGTGNCSRRVNNFGAAARAGGADGQGLECDKLIPGGNWSSFPPHKHDEHRPGEEAVLEEIYYFEIDGPGGCGYPRVSPSGRGRNTDVLAEVRGGDVVLIPDGWHGPSMAVPGHHMYYLDVMAGPEAERVRLIRDHPDHAGVRDPWPDQPADPRLPLYTAPEKS